MSEKRSADRATGLSAISVSFLENFSFLKKFLATILAQQQDIEDVVQETYLKAYRAEQDCGIEQPKAFLFSIARNLALNELKRKARQRTDYIEDCESTLDLGGSSTLEEEIEADQSLGIYCEAVAALPERCRRVYLLRTVYGLKHREIAERLGMSLSAVEKHLSAGVLSCRAYIRQQHESRPGGAPESPARLAREA